MNHLSQIIQLAGLKTMVETEHPVPPAEISPIQLEPGVDFENLRPEVKDALKGAAAEYLKIKGKPMRIISGYRSPEWQIQGQKRWDAGDRKGLQARPGDPDKSPHPKGLAIDSPDAAEMEELGILSKFNLARTEKDIEDWNHIQFVPPKDDQVQIAKVASTNAPKSTSSQFSPLRSEPGPRGIPKSKITSVEPTPFDTTPPTPVKSVSTTTLQTTGKNDMDKLDAFAKLNNIRDVTKTIHPGQIFKLPDGSSYEVQRGDNLWNMANMKLKGTPIPSKTAVPSPSTVTPDTEKPIPTATVNLDPDEIAAQNKADMEYLKSQGQEVYDPNEFPDDELDNMRDRMLQNLPKQTPTSASPNLDVTGKPYPAGSTPYQQSQIDAFRKAGITRDLSPDDLKLWNLPSEEPAPPTPKEPPAPFKTVDDMRKEIEAQNQTDAVSKAQDAATAPTTPTPPQNTPQSQDDSFLDRLKSLGGVASDKLSSADKWLDTNVREPLVKAGIASPSILPQEQQPKAESTDINNIRKLAGLKGN